MDLSRPDAWCARAVELGADHATALDAARVVVAEWVRMKCLFGCEEPGAHRTCPPHVPPVAVIRQMVGEYRRAVLLEVGPVRGEERDAVESRRVNDAALALERELFLAGHHRAWMMGCGPCELCEACRKGRACPTPQKARPSMEGCGIDVYTTVRNAGRRIEVARDRDDEYRCFALVLVE